MDSTRQSNSILLVISADPINIVKLFNDKEAYELAILDISATPERKSPDFNYLSEIAGECFMPIGYGGGIRAVQDIRKVLSMGYEKVIINAEAVRSPDLVQKGSKEFGSQSIVVSIDVRKGANGGYEVHTNGGRGEDWLRSRRTRQEHGKAWRRGDTAHLHRA